LVLLLGFALAVAMFLIYNLYMLLTSVKQQGQYVERLVKSKDGSFVLLTFYVEMRFGRPHGRLISAKKITAQPLKASTLQLPVHRTKEEAPVGRIAPAQRRIPSPYQRFAFFKSQPTRAPSL
jgi:hypothetical protein